MLGLGRRGDLIIEKGDVVQEADIRDIPKLERKDYLKAAARHNREAPGTRLAYFKAEGVIRYAVAMDDLMPCRAKITVPAEAKRA